MEVAPRSGLGSCLHLALHVFIIIELIFHVVVAGGDVVASGDGVVVVVISLALVC